MRYSRRRRRFRRPFKRFFKRRRYTGRRKHYYGKDRQVVKVKETLRYADAITIAASSVNSYKTFTASELYSWSSYASVFDEYRLKGIRVTILWDRQCDIQEPASGIEGGYIIPMWIFWDHHGVETMNWSGFERAQGAVYRPLYKPGYVYKGYSKVYALSPQYASSTSWVYYPSKHWIPTTSGGVPHYALRWAYDTSSLVTVSNLGQYVGRLSFNYTYYLEFRQRK